MPCLSNITAWLTRFAAGAAAALAFVFAMLPASAGTITNQALAASLVEARLAARSNDVVVVTPDMPTVQFYTDASYTHVAAASSVGQELYVSVTAQGCNLNPNAPDTIGIMLHSAITGEVVMSSALETGVNTSVFRGKLPTASGRSSNGVRWTSTSATLQTAFNDTIDASFSDCAGIATTSILIDPSGLVFDSVTNAPLMGAVVTLLDMTGAGNGGAAGQPAHVFGDDGVTPVPATYTTLADGRYTFPKVAPSQYKLVVVPPNGYSYPSKVAASGLPPGHEIDVPGSFGGTFRVDESTGNIFADIPVDEIPHSLFVQKTASRSSAGVAESVAYSVSVKNAGDGPLDGISLMDQLPPGFTYLGGTAYVDGKKVADPTGGRGPVLTFPLAALASGATHTVQYRVMIGPLALNSDGINHAQAHSSIPFSTTSNMGLAQVKVASGVFTDQAMVLGKVYADCNANGLQDDGEPGIPGVRLFMEDGSFVITDGIGQFSFYGVSAKTHVLKLDATTLPAGMTPLALSSRHAGDGNSRFVDPRKGELHRADFPLGGCTVDTAETLKARARAGQEIDQALKADFRADGAAQPVGDARALPASGLIGSNGTGGNSPTTLAALAEALKAAASPDTASSPSAAASGAVAPATSTTTSTTSTTSMAPDATLAQRIEGMDNKLGFVDLHEDQTLATTQATLRIKGPAQVLLSLDVDGQALGAERVGTRLEDSEHQLQAMDFIGVPLAAGEHQLELQMHDSFGNLRGSVRIKLQVAGALASIKLTVPDAGAPADGQTLVPVHVQLLDERGQPVGVRTAVTLDTTLGEWNVADLDPRTPGVQTFIEGGSAQFTLRAAGAPGSAALHVSSGKVAADASVEFVPALRPLIAAGIIEGALNLRHLSAGALTPATASDGFETELRSFAGNDEHSANGRAAMFLKGKVRGDYLLTLGYDSDKDTHTQLFRDIRPDQFYPVYGDSSVKGFDAQSTSRLYVRVEHGKSFLLYGDFVTQTTASSGPRQLGAYQRSLNGAKEHYEDDVVSANVFASRATSKQVIDEFPANGTSGPFQLSGSEPLDNSEKVEVLVRDRNQPSVVLQATTQVRFVDYDLEPLTGRLLMRGPVPSLDANLNPMSIRVTYEADQGGAAFWVAGADAQVKVNKAVEVGGSFVKDQDPSVRAELGSVNATVRPDEHTAITVEAAQTRNEVEGKGNARRVEITHDDDRLKVHATAGRTDATFDNASSSLNAGRAEANVKASYGIDERTRLIGEAVHTGDVTSGAHRDGELVGVERSFDGGIKLEAGARHVHDVPSGTATTTTTTTTSSAESPAATVTNDPTAATDTTTVRAKLSVPVPGVAAATVSAEGEQDVHDKDKRLLAVGGDYRIGPQTRLYVRHELISSLTGPIALDNTQRRNTTLFGVDSDVTKDSHLFSEYRVRDGIDGRDAEAAIGLRNQWTLAPGLRANTSAERVKSLSGTDSGQSAALTGALEYTRDPLLKATTRLELRDATTSRSLLSTVGVARKLDDDWTFLGRNAYALTQEKSSAASTTTTTVTDPAALTVADQPNHWQERFQLGLAYRDSLHNRVNGLARYEFKADQGGLDVDRRIVHTISAHADWQAQPRLMLTGEYAAKLAYETLAGVQTDSAAQLVTARATRDISERWDAGIAVRVLGSGRFADRTVGAGAEAGYRVMDNLWMSAGYNITGFKERDLTADGGTQRGVYIRLRWKFDESLFAGKGNAP